MTKIEKFAKWLAENAHFVQVEIAGESMWFDTVTQTSVTVQELVQIFEEQTQ